jgi:hypothetical protein
VTSCLSDKHGADEDVFASNSPTARRQTVCNFRARLRTKELRRSRQPRREPTTPSSMYRRSCFKRTVAYWRVMSVLKHWMHGCEPCPRRHRTVLGYARVSTGHQSLDQQVDPLVRAGVDGSRIYTDELSGTSQASHRDVARRNCRDQGRRYSESHALSGAHRRRTASTCARFKPPVLN